MSTTDMQTELHPWEPTRQELPPQWVQLARALIEDMLGSTGHQYILRTMYDGRRVGELLHQWGLDWQVVLAGYLWDCSREAIREANLPERERVLRLIQEADRYKQYIEDDNLLRLLTPPYDDLGGLLIAVATQYTTLQTLLQVRKERPTADKIDILRGKIERIRATLLHITKRLGMWRFKRDIEDLCAEMLEPDKFARDYHEYNRTLDQDKVRLQTIQEQLTSYYEQATAQPVMITYDCSGIAGLHRRYQDAHTTITTQKTQLTGFDLVTFDIIVPTVCDCYVALGILDQLGYIQDRVTDRIAHPKSNGHSSIALGLNLDLHHPFLHSSKMGNAEMLNCQIQIRTRMMQAITNYGCLYPLCYALYHQPATFPDPPGVKEFWHSTEGKTFYTIQKAIAQQYQHLQCASYESEAHQQKPIIAYDQNDRSIFLPKGATVLDFAYTSTPSNIPTGEQAIEAFINSRKAPLNRTLDMGDVVQITLSRETSLSRHLLWLREEYATLPEVKQQIKEDFQKHSIDRNNNSYNRLYSMVTGYYPKLTPEELDEELYKLVTTYQLGSLNAYIECLNKNEAAPSSSYTLTWATERIVKQITDGIDALRKEYRWFLTENTDTRKRLFPQKFCSVCCRTRQPIYPDEVIGLLHTRGKQFVIHHPACPRLAYGTHQKGPRILLEWQNLQVFRVGFSVGALDRRGLVYDITSQLRYRQCVLCFTQGDLSQDGKYALIRFVIETYNEQEALNIRKTLAEIENVKSVSFDALLTPTRIYERLQMLWQEQKLLEDVPEELETVAEPLRRSTILKNPFDISRPASAKMFHGRTQQISLMQHELCNSEQGRAILMYGPRRSGKSSLCKNFLEHHVPPQFLSVYHTFQGASRHNERTILKHLASDIQRAFQQRLNWAQLPSRAYENSDPQIRFKRMLQAYLEALPGSRLVLVLDEFGGVLDSFEHKTLEERFFTYWRELIDDIPQLSLILVLPTSSHHTLITKVPANAFSFAREVAVPFLDGESARQLLADPLKEQNILVEPDVTAQAVDVTAGNPYFMTLLGMRLVQQLNRDPLKSRVNKRDLQIAIDQLVQENTHNQFDFYRAEVQDTLEMHILEKIVEHSENTMTTKARTVSVSLQNMARNLKESPNTVRKALERMCVGLLLKEYSISATNANPHYGFKIELVRRWMAYHRDFFTSYHEVHP